MAARFVFAVWGLLCVALTILGGVWLYARRRGVNPDELLCARPHIVMGAAAVWGAALSVSALVWAWVETGGLRGPGWFFLPLVPLAVCLGLVLGLRQAGREHKKTHEGEVNENVQA